MMSEIKKYDKYISFQESGHDNPYDAPEVLKIEDTFGFMMAYRKPYNKNSRKSLKNYRNRLTKYCRGCLYFPDGCKVADDTCRVHHLKSAMTREIRCPRHRHRC